MDDEQECVRVFMRNRTREYEREKGIIDNPVARFYAYNFF